MPVVVLCAIHVAVVQGVLLSLQQVSTVGHNVVVGLPPVVRHPSPLLGMLIIGRQSHIGS